MARRLHNHFIGEELRECLAGFSRVFAFMGGHDALRLLHPVPGLAVAPESYDKQFPDMIVQRRSSGTHDSGRIPFRRFVVSNRISLREARHLSVAMAGFPGVQAVELAPIMVASPDGCPNSAAPPVTLDYLDGPTFARKDLYRTCIKPKRATQLSPNRP